jgi:penicillin-binding protein 2
LITGIGQAYLLATPLQLAVMASRLVNGGMAVRPRLSRHRAPEQQADGNIVQTAANADQGAEANGDGPAAAQAIGVSAANLKIITDAMSEVVNGKRGTARKYKLDPALKFQMGGKTGTAQVRRISKAERKAGGKLAKETPWKERDHALFTAFAPVGAPRYATAVVVEHGGSGTYAAKLTKDVMTEVLRRNPLDRAAVGLNAGAGRNSAGNSIGGKPKNRERKT